MPACPLPTQWYNEHSENTRSRETEHGLVENLDVGPMQVMHRANEGTDPMICCQQAHMTYMSRLCINCCCCKRGCRASFYEVATSKLAWQYLVVLKHSPLPVVGQLRLHTGQLLALLAFNLMNMASTHQICTSSNKQGST